MVGSEIVTELEALIGNLSEGDFVFGFLSAYGIPKSTVTRLKGGAHNRSKRSDEVILRNKLAFRVVKDADLHATIDDLKHDPSLLRQKARFIVVTDFRTLLAVDMKVGEHLDTPITDLPKHFDFFLPLSGKEKYRHKEEHPADRKAAEKMARLYDGILAENEIDDEKRTNDLNVFLTRLLFCFFAEDTGIFEGGLFTESVASHTAGDGSDLSEYLAELFSVLNRKEDERSDVPTFFRRFPYVNGGLFRDAHWIPTFSARSRRLIVECGELDWSKINPDIFGSMMQAVVHPGQRASLGMHYTSVPNIMKVIGPLFLDGLREEFEKSRGNKKRLDALRLRISRMKFFDPACGSGNFLVIAFKELRRLEMEIIHEMDAFSFTDLKLTQFYGIEIDDFAHEVAKLSLYLAEHQMNVEFKEEFGNVQPTLPLRESGNIVCGNATRIDWESVCPKEKSDEIYIFGNPPYLGYSLQNKNQKKEIEDLCKANLNAYKELDYISCWFIKAANYIYNTAHKFAFVSTNSICQGEQVFMLWPYVFLKKLEIFFAHQSFKWTNNAKKNAGVTCIVVGIESKEISPKRKTIISDKTSHLVKHINAYLIEASDVIVERRSAPLSKDFPKIVLGSMAKDNGNLFLTAHERDVLVGDFPEAKQYVKRTLGSLEFIRGLDSFCLWIEDGDLEDAINVPFIADRLEKVSAFRSKSVANSTVEYAKHPNRFKQRTHMDTPSIIVPRVSSERREYIPAGFLNKDVVVKDSAYAIYNAEPWIFGVISSRMHMVWVRAVAGRLKTDYRYSSALVYNTFPIPSLTVRQKEEISRYVFNVLGERERHSEKTMAELYDPDKMPDGLREAHRALDQAVERLYRSRPFTSDEERLEHLFGLYERMIGEEKKT